MPAYGFPTTTEVTTLEGTTISTTVNNGYNFITGEKPVPSSKFRGLVKAVKDITAYVKADDEALITPTLATGWGNFAGFQPTRYWKDKNNVVHITGMPQRTSGSSTTIFTLPAGYRPTVNQLYKMVMYSGTSYVQCDIRISTAGIVETGGAVYASASNFVPLAGIYFRTV